jgi:hypothetical protein
MIKLLKRSQPSRGNRPNRAKSGGSRVKRRLQYGSAVSTFSHSAILQVIDPHGLLGSNRHISHGKYDNPSSAVSNRSRGHQGGRSDVRFTEVSQNASSE